MDAEGEAVHQLPVAATQDEIERAGTSWDWVKFGLITCGLWSGISAVAFLWLISLPPIPNCQRLSPLFSDRDRLFCAQEAVRSGELPKLVAGLALLEEWTADDPLYAEAQRWLDQWSESLLVAAQQKMADSDLQGAIALADQVPATSPRYKEARAAIAQWQHQWGLAEKLYLSAQRAMQQQKWQVATQKIVALRSLADPYWRTQRANALTQELWSERQSRKWLTQARQLAQPGDLSALGQAMALVGKIRPNTQAWEEVQPDLRRWSETLLAAAFHLWQQDNLDGAIALARRVTVNPHLAATAEQLTWLSYARRLALAGTSNWRAQPTQIGQLMLATAIAATIPPGSRYAPIAQTSLRQWRQQLEDTTQLHLAQGLAHLGHPISLEWAIAQAQQLSPNRPQRIQAQTLVAHWRLELERIQDRPALMAAQRKATTGSPTDLSQAIALAQAIAPHRALHREARILMAGWQRQIQIAQDQPILDQARTLAQAGQLDKAIQVAGRIRPGRALYLQARTAVTQWETQLPPDVAPYPAIARAPVQPQPAWSRRSGAIDRSTMPLPPVSQESPSSLTGETSPPDPLPAAATPTTTPDIASPISTPISNSAQANAPSIVVPVVPVQPFSTAAPPQNQTSEPFPGQIDDPEEAH